MAECILQVKGLTKRFGETVAVDRVSLEVMRGELVTLLGPSGCGKTTLLRMVAGLEDPTSGSIQIAGKNQVGIPPHRRPVNTVFQRYALFPHLNVFDNVAFGLRLRRMDPGVVEEKVLNAIRLVGLGGFEKRSVTKLSGGEAQRVALARSLVMEPQVLLLDEPLGALDLKIRQRMQIELKSLHKEIGGTFLYVTHDQSEAMTLSDRIVLMNRGRVVQIGSPREIYINPNCAFCASFIGESNILRCSVLESESGGAVVEFRGKRLRARGQGPVGGEVEVLVRPEMITIEEAEGPQSGENVLQGEVIDAVFSGSNVHYRVDVGGGEVMQIIRAARTGMRIFGRGQAVCVSVSADEALVLPGEPSPS